jgi:hypothetical protein
MYGGWRSEQVEHLGLSVETSTKPYGLWPVRTRGALGTTPCAPACVLTSNASASSVRLEQAHKDLIRSTTPDFLVPLQPMFSSPCRAAHSASLRRPVSNQHAIVLGRWLQAGRVRQRQAHLAPDVIQRHCAASCGRSATHRRPQSPLLLGWHGFLALVFSFFFLLFWPSLVQEGARASALDW